MNSNTVPKFHKHYSLNGTMAAFNIKGRGHNVNTNVEYYKQRNAGIVPAFLFKLDPLAN